MDGNAARVVHEAMIAINEARNETFERVVRARAGLVTAQREYEEALLDAAELGLSATDLSRACGTSEAAIRLFIKRRKDKK